MLHASLGEMGFRGLRRATVIHFEKKAAMNAQGQLELFLDLAQVATTEQRIIAIFQMPAARPRVS